MLIRLLIRLKKTLILFRKANVIGAGTWNSADDFGDPLLFRRSIATNGYFIFAQSLADQVQSSRVNRESPADFCGFKTCWCNSFSRHYIKYRGVRNGSIKIF